MNLSNKNIILTGASSGIGQELLAKLCKYDNTKIIAVARNTDNIPKGRNIFPFSADLSKEKEVDRLFEYGEELFGTIDIFIANAGFAYLEELNEPDWQHIEKIYSLNTTSVIYSLLKFSSQDTEKPLQFACTLSAVAFVPLHGYALYCSSKAALHQFIESYRYEQKGNLTITAIYPVATKTAFFDHASGADNTPAPWPQQRVESVVKKIIRGIEKGKSRIYPSTLYRIFYPIGRAFPIFLKIYSSIEKGKTKKWLKMRRGL